MAIEFEDSATEELALLMFKEEQEDLSFAEEAEKAKRQAFEMSRGLENY